VNHAPPRIEHGVNLALYLKYASDSAGRFKLDLEADPGVPPELQESYVRASFAAKIAGVDQSTIFRHCTEYGTLSGITIGERLLLVSREEMRWWTPLKRGPKPKEE